jgi:hypothetical protein
MIQALEYGDTSATYWKLYGTKADKYCIELLLKEMESMVFLVRGNAHC